MEKRKIPFVRVLRLEGMRFGLAVDKAGKKWRGFFANRSDMEILQTADLGSVGLCMVCRSRVHEGWNCLNDNKDLCESCAQHPPEGKVFVVEKSEESNWEALQKEFFGNANFDYKRRDQGSA